MDRVFHKLLKGTSLKSGPSAKVVLFKAKREEEGRFDEQFKVVDSNGVDFKEYRKLEAFADLLALTKEESAGAAASITEALESRYKIEAPTPIQQHAIPVVLEGRDLVGIAPTGSGKTLAYLIPILLTLENPKGGEREGPNVLILVPTFELVRQVKSELSYLTKGSADVVALEKDLEWPKNTIAVSTPFTLSTLLEKHKEMLNSLEILVLDEVDKLVDESQEVLAQLTAALNARNQHPGDENSKAAASGVQKLCFSSTIHENVLALVRDFLCEPVHVTIGAENVCCCNVDQELICVTNDKGKTMILKQLITEGKILPPALIFLQSVKRVNDLHHELGDLNLKVEKFTKELTLKQRQSVIKRFRIGEIWMLLCSDILSRGLDLRGVHSVVNYDLPLNAQTYINRVGRAGRGRKRGRSFTLFTLNDVKIMGHIVHIMRLSNSKVPDYLLTQTKSPGRNLVSKPPTRLGIHNSRYTILDI